MCLWALISCIPHYCKQFKDELFFIAPIKCINLSMLVERLIVNILILLKLCKVSEVV